MSHLDLARYAVSAMLHRSLRSWLTILGVVIGIAAIVALVSIGYGINSYITKQLEAFGSNFVSVSPGSPRTGGQAAMFGTSPFVGTRAAILTTNDANAIKGLAGVQSVYTIIGTRGDVEYRGEIAGCAVAGVSAGLFKDFSQMLTIEEGRALTESDSHVVVIGKKIANGTFKEEVELGRTLIIGNTSYRVVGLLGKTEGSPFPVDNVVFMPYDDAQAYMTGIKEPNQVDLIVVQTAPSADPGEVAHEITLKLRNVRHVSEETQDFKVNTATTLLERINTITSVLSLFLGGIAAISLIVGGVGIANTMFMAVTERTQEIGVMKAIGATERDILEIFLIESGLIGLVGGVLGVVLGAAVSVILNQFGVPTTLKPELLVFAVLFAFVVGAVSGFFPARRAARMEPVVALGFGR